MIVEDAPAVAPVGPRKTLSWLRVIAVLHSLCAVAQPALAGLYLSGVVDARFIHGRNGDAVIAFGLFQLIAAIVHVWRGRGHRWPLWTAIALFLAENVQMPLGIEGVVALHIPLGVSIIAAQVLFTVWLFRATAYRRRP